MSFGTRRFSPLSFLAAVLALATLCPPAVADYRVDVAAGFDSSYRPDTWTPAYVRVTGTGYDADGEVQILVRTRSGVATYGKPVRLHAGATDDTYAICYLQPDAGDLQGIEARVLADGRAVAGKKLEGMLPLQDGQVAILALTQEGGGLNFLNNADLGIVHRSPIQPGNPYAGTMNGPYTSNRPRNPVRVIYPRAVGMRFPLPESPGAYAGIDAVLLGDLPLDSLTEDQWNAIVRWVKDGGVLVVSGGADINRARNPKLAELLPITPTGVRQVRALPSLADRYESAPRFASTPLITGSLRTDAMALCRDGDTPVVSVRRVGNGLVAFTAFDMQAPEFRDWPGETRMWQEILQVGAPEVRAAETLRAANQQSRWPWGGYTSEGRILRDALAGKQSTEAPSFAYIGTFLVLYILCLVPVNYFLLRKRDRRELAWITAPAIILLFSTGAYAVGYSIKGGQLFLRYCSVIEGAANDDSWSAYSVASIFSPRQDRYDLSIADPYALPTEVTEGSASGFDRPTADIAVVRSQKTTVRNFPVSMWDTRNYDFQSHLSLGGRVIASVSPAGGNALRVQLTNSTGHALADCQVSAPGGVQPVGTLLPGQSWSGNVSLGSGAASNALQIASPGGDYGATTTQIRQAMASLLSSNPGGAQGNPPLIFSGWFSDPVVGLSLENNHPTVEGVNLLVVHLSRPGSTGTVPPPQTPISTGVVPQPGGPLGNPGGFGGTRNAQYYNGLAYSYANQGDLNAAMRAANQAMALAPQDGMILDTVGEMHQRRKEYKAAAQFYARALQKLPREGATETHEKYGETLLALGKRKEAIVQLRTAAQSPSSWGAKAQQVLNKLGAAK